MHIPKTAGTAVEVYFGNSYGGLCIQPEKHDDIFKIKKKFPEIYNSYRKFTIVRNPYDRVLSYYFYLRRNVLRDAPNVRLVDFNEWIKYPKKLSYNFNIGGYADDAIFFNLPQYYWVDETVTILKFENLKEELDLFFGEEIDLPVVNKSEHDHYSKYYNRESLDIVYNRHKEDFDEYNYKKL